MNALKNIGIEVLLNKAFVGKITKMPSIFLKEMRPECILRFDLRCAGQFFLLRTLTLIELDGEFFTDEEVGHRSAENWELECLILT